MRSWLFVPGDRPDQFAKAIASGTDEVIVDLQDAVVPQHKESARKDVVRWLAGGGTSWVRVNGAGTSWHQDDLAALSSSPGLRGVVLPRTQGQGTVRRVERALPDTEILALIETAVGVHDALSVAACVAVRGLAFGSIGFALDIGADGSDESLLFARSSLVVSSRAAGLPPPVDGITLDTRSTDSVRAAAVQARRLGFGGKLCIHPAQVAAVNHAFGPDHTNGLRTDRLSLTPASV